MHAFSLTAQELEYRSFGKQWIYSVQCLSLAHLGLSLKGQRKTTSPTFSAKTSNYSMMPKTVACSGWPSGKSATILTFVLCDISSHPIPCTRSVLNNFSNSQHHLVMICIGLQVLFIWSLLKPCWYLQSADWSCYVVIVEGSVNWNPPYQAH